ncbi:O-methyltransferase MdmC-like isoform X1 [Camellia sinensis]|uniref:O-methyltransferase MdmC-like isoform X1 n=2 Tax=Camellia sinensis TaxID=4442 RepID=UPI001036B280|nr:O-methyltransferase MdmC-like isoform X1 [Camellia sinensis]
MSGPDVFLPTCPSMAASLLPRSTYPRLIFAPLFSLQRDLLLPSSDRLVHVSSPIAAFNRRFRAQNSNNSADATVVAGDENYGNKRVISVTPRLYDYLLSNVREPEILKELREETATRRGSQMQVSPDQAQLLAMLVQILGAEKCIEVGVYTGYSSLAIALVLPESGRLVACERDMKSLEVAKRYYDRAGVSHKVDVKHGMAADALKSMIQKGESCSYDFAFVDAEKRMYHEYFELLLQLVRVGGLIVIDNVLWHGKVANPLVNDAKTVSIRNFNRSVMEDKRVSISMVPIGDGMTICRKL